MRQLSLVAAALCAASALEAHDIILTPGNPMNLSYNIATGVAGAPGKITIQPESGELCTVSATAIPADSSIVRVALPAGQGNPSLTVIYNVTPLDIGSTSIKVQWQATGLNTAGVLEGDCNGAGDLTFTVNVTGQSSSATATTSGENVNAGHAGEPVSTADGELYGYDETPDLTVRGPLPLVFRRYYSSNLSASGLKSALGTNWMSNFDVSLNVSGSKATVELYRGKTVSFQLTGNIWQSTSNEQRPFQLIASGGGFQFLDIRSNMIYGFNSTGALVSVQDRNNNKLTVTPGASGPAQISDGIGRTLTLSYTGANLTRVQDQAGRFVTFEYGGGNLSAATDADGKRTTYAYTTAGSLTGLLTSATRPNGNQPFSQQFDSRGRVSTQADGLGNTMTFTYTSTGALDSIPGGPTFTDAHDNNLNLITHSDTSGGSTKYTYDGSNRVLTATDRTGAVESLTWDAASGLPATHTDKAGNKTAYTYASSGANGFTYYDLTRTAFADGTSVSSVRDGNGNITGWTDQAGNQWQFSYNAAGQPVTMTNPSGGVTTLTYGADGSLATVKTPSGDTTTVGVDAAKRLNLVTNPDGTSRGAVYNGRDNLTGLTDENGHSTSFSFDGNDNPSTMTDALNTTASVAHDADDRVSGMTDTLGRSTTETYDSAGRLKSDTDASGVAVSYVNDALNRPTQILDAAGSGLSLGYDQESRVTSSTDALSRTITLTRDSRGLITGVKTPKGETASTAYDVLSRPVTLTDQLGRVASLTYDARGFISSVALPGGVSSSYVRNGLGRLTSQSDPNGNAWTRGFDTQGRLTSKTDPLGRTTKLQYDSRQRVSTLTLPLGTQQNTFDAAGNLVGRSWSDGATLSYTRDADNRITGGTGFSISYDTNGRISSSNGLQITRDARGRIASIVYATGKTVKYTYDNRGLLTQVTDWSGGATTFTYDAAHQLTSRTLANGVTESFTYDADGRLLTSQAAKGSNTFSSVALTRDALGRVTGASRSTPSVPDVPTGYFGQEFDAASQSLNGAWDSNGREVQDALTGRNYTWNLAGRLMSYTGSNGSASFTYDALGQRVSRTDGNGTQNYVVNYALALPSVATVQSGGADIRYYVWLPGGQLLESIEASNGARHFYHFDESGTTTFLTDDTGAVTDSYATTPYGETVVQTGSTPNPFTFEGAYGVMQEGGTGLYYMRARYYDSAAARFLSKDPIPHLDPGAASPYQFVHQNPVEGRDPTGMDEPSLLRHDINGYVRSCILKDFLDFGEFCDARSSAERHYDPIVSLLNTIQNLNLDTQNWGAGAEPAAPFSWTSSVVQNGDPYIGLDFGDLNDMLDAVLDSEEEAEAVEEEADESTVEPPPISTACESSALGVCTTQSGPVSDCSAGALLVCTASPSEPPQTGLLAGLNYYLYVTTTNEGALAQFFITSFQLGSPLKPPVSTAAIGTAP